MTTLVTAITRPQPGEYNPYYDRYISLVESDDILATLEKQAPQTIALLTPAAKQADFRYAPGKWTLKEVLGHVNDTERIMTYRALRIARGDKTPIEGFEQDDYIREGNFGQRTLADLIDEFAVIRKATLEFFRHLDAESAIRRGTANNDEISARALPFIIAGHELHHRRILQEKYLK
jgi:hypothetical protein